jgi:PHD/YefM family antitoxin component YafN of YafNO toxin-antitoxin module
MLETTADYLRQNLQQQVARCVESHEVLHVKQDEGESFVVLGVGDWQAIEETLFLNRIPGLVESIHQAHQEVLEKGGMPLEELDW